MRGADITQESLFTVAKLDDFVPVNHPLRAIRKLANTALQRMSALFDTLYADTGRTSIAPEKLMRAQLLQLLYSLRSERMLMEQLGYNLLFRWFVGLAIDEGMLNNSLVVPFPTMHEYLDKNKEQLKDKKILFYCAHGHRSTLAVQISKSYNFTNCCHLIGGLNNWKKEGLGLS